MDTCVVCGIPADAGFFDESTVDNPPPLGQELVLARFALNRNYCGSLLSIAQFTDRFAGDPVEVRHTGVSVATEVQRPAARSVLHVRSDHQPVGLVRLSRTASDSGGLRHRARRAPGGRRSRQDALEGRRTHPRAVLVKRPLWRCAAPPVSQVDGGRGPQTPPGRARGSSYRSTRESPAANKKERRMYIRVPTGAALARPSARSKARSRARSLAMEAPPQPSRRRSLIATMSSPAR